MPFGSDPFGAFLRRRRPQPDAEDPPDPTVADEFAGTELSLDPFDAFMTKRRRTGPGLSRTARAIGDALEFTFEKPVKPIADAADAFSEWTQNKGGRVLPYVGAFTEGVAQQATPANLAMTAFGLKAPGKIPGLMTPGGPVALNRGAESMLALRDMARLGETAAGSFQAGMGAGAAKEAYDEGDYKRAALAGGMTALGAFAAASGVPGLRKRFYDIKGDLLPAARDRSIAGKVTPPDIEVGVSGRRMLPGETIDGDVVPQEAVQRQLPGERQRLLTAGDDQELLPPAGGTGRGPGGGYPMPPVPPTRLPSRTPMTAARLSDQELRDAFLEATLNGEDVAPFEAEIARRGPLPESSVPGATAENRPLGTRAAPAREGGVPRQPSAPMAPEGIDLAIERQKLQAQGFPSSLIDRIMSDLVAGKSEAPQPGTPGTVTPPDPRIAQLPSLDARMAAARARREAEPPPAAIEGQKPEVAPDSPGSLEQLLGMVEAGKSVTPETAFADMIADPNVDPLTNILNRRGWDRQAGAKPGRIIGRADADNFKGINDKFGHAEGDRALRVISDTLRRFARRNGDRVARLGGDEFGLDLEAPPGEHGPLRDQIESAVASALREAGFPEDVGLSLGFGADEAAADAAAMARKAARAVSKPRDARGPLHWGPEGIESPGGSPEGTNPQGGALERRPLAAGGLDIPAGHGDRPVGSQAVARPRKSAIERHAERIFPDYLADARKAGFTGSDDELRAAFDERVRSSREFIEEIDATAAENSPTALLKELRRIGGLRPFDREIGSGRKLRGDAESIIESFSSASGRGLRGASGVFRNDGVGWDDAIDQLRSTGKFPHLRDVNDLIDELDTISRTDRDLGWESPRLEEVLQGAHGMKPGSRWWLDQGDDSFNPAELEGDILASGETQPRLPGDVGAVRGKEIPTPEFDAPFSLSPQVSKAPDAAATSLLDAPAEVGLDDIDKALTVRSLSDISTRHEVRSPEKVTAIAGSMRRVGWKGRPVLVLKDGDNLTAWTATHRLEAAKQAGLSIDDVPMRIVDAQALRDAGYSVDDLTTRGKNTRIKALRAAGQEDAAQLLEQEQAAAAAERPSTPDVPEFGNVPPNVRDFLVRQLGYTDKDLAGMPASDIYRIGREKIRNPEAPSKYERPREVVTKAPGESYDLAKMSNIAPDLEEFLGLEVPKRLAQAERRMTRAKETRGVSLDRVNRVEGETQVPAARQQRDVIPPVTRRGIAASTEALNAQAADQAADAAASEARAGETASQRQSRVATMQSEQRRAVKEMQAAFNRGDYKTYAQKLGEAAQRFWKRSAKMGTRVENDEPGQFLGMGLGMAQAIIKDPKKYAELTGEMLRNPAVRAAIGAVAGGAIDDDERMRGALYGALLAAGTPTGLKALVRGFKNVSDGKPLLSGANKKDISRWRIAYGANLEASVPDVFRKVREMELELDKLYAGAWSKETKVSTAKHTRQLVGRVLADAAKEAKAAGMKRKAWLLDGYARRYRGVPTQGQRNVQGVLDTVFGEKRVNAADVERHANSIIHRTLIGYALDSAIANQLQPVLALLHVSPKNLVRGVRASGTKAGRSMTEFLKLPKRAGEDVISETRELLGKDNRNNGGIIGDPGRPLRVSDDSNRRRVYLAFLDREGWLDKALAGKKVPDEIHERALSIVRRTQGDPGPLGRNPFHRGPIMGPATAFQKYPGIFLENLADAFNDPHSRGKAFVASIAGLMAVGRLLGIDMEDMLLSGGRPLGIDPMHPGETLKRGISVLPAGRALVDVGKHLSGTANHSFASLPGEGFLDSDVAQLVLGRYPVKFMKRGGEVVSQGLGEHLPESVSDNRPAHTGIDDLASLVGIRTTRQTDAQDAAREARRFKERSRQQQLESTRDHRTALENAIRSGDSRAIQDAEQAMTPKQRRDFYRRRNMTPYQRQRQTVPRDKRQEFDERFKEQLDR